MSRHASSRWPRAASTLGRAVCAVLALAALGEPAAAEGLADPNAAGPTEPAPAAASDTPADAMAACLDAHGQSQELRQAGLLLDARETLMRCAEPTCPELVSADCLRWRDELQRQLPSVVFRVTVDGKPQSDVAVFLDGKPLLAELPTKALDVNPGKHTFTFVWGTLPPIEREISIGDGEKYATIDVAFETHASVTGPGDASPGPAAPASEALPPSADRSRRIRPVPWPTYVLGGVGAAGVVGFVGFGLATRSLEQDLQSSCSPRCPESQIERVRQRAMLADLSLGVGAAALIAAGTYYLVRPYRTVQVGAVISPPVGAHAQVSVAF